MRGLMAPDMVAVSPAGDLVVASNTSPLLLYFTLDWSTYARACNVL